MTFAIHWIVLDTESLVHVPYSQGASCDSLSGDPDGQTPRVPTSHDVIRSALLGDR